jgi:hypothetical protein
LCVPFFIQTVEEVGLGEVDADAVARGVFSRDGERGGRDVGRGDVGVGEMARKRDGDGSGAGADVKNAQWFLWIKDKCGGPSTAPLRGFARDDGILVFAPVGEFHKDGFHEVLGLGAGDEDGGCDAEGEAKELLLAGDVLEGLVLQAAGDGGRVGGLLFWRDDAAGVGVELRARDAERVQQEGEGIARGGVAQIA